MVGFKAILMPSMSFISICIYINRVNQIRSIDKESSLQFSKNIIEVPTESTFSEAFKFDKEFAIRITLKFKSRMIFLL